METRKRLYVSGFVGASISYIFNVVAFTGGFDVGEWAVFIVLFLLVFAGFEKFIAWSGRLESSD